MKTPHGGKQFVLLFAYTLLVSLSGCSEGILLELQNEGDETVYALDFRKRTVAVPIHATAKVSTPGPTLVINRPLQCSFDLRRVPGKYFHSSRLGGVIYAVVDRDRSLHLASKTKDGKLQVIKPQPEGFPLKGEKLDPKWLKWIQSE